MNSVGGGPNQGKNIETVVQIQKGQKKWAEFSLLAIIKTNYIFGLEAIPKIRKRSGYIRIGQDRSG